MVHSNVVEKESLRRIQVETMDILTKALANSFGPFGSNSIIDMDKGLPRYSKDGHTILSRIQFSDPIARSVQSDIEEETRTQAVKIGDSTTSITLLSAFIFKALAKYEEKHPEKTPRSIVEDFKKITSMIADRIKAHGREATIEDMRKIALISTNGN
ncbi:MAG: TCP-1/cpn60 chaperonin family protein, partial [Eubacterium sp.]|nr:TCP-1/cpn60 chaperonin family protein [Eubacterium sp.]